MRRALPVLIGLLMFSSAALCEQFYKWKDENGVWHYSAKAPKDQPVDKVDVRASASDAPKSADDEDNADATADAKSKTKTNAAESPNCTAARANLQILNNSPQVAKDLDGDGTAETLTLEQHRAEIALAEQQKSAFCPREPAAKAEAEEAAL